MSTSPKPASVSHIQYAALPYRRAGGETEVMLVTSRRTGRWIIPKGWPMKGKSPCATAACEALEEAGVLGRIGKAPIGSYSYEKELKGGEVVGCRVFVYLLEVERQRRNWPERDKRQTRWLSPIEAASSVRETVLAQIIRQFARTRSQVAQRGPAYRPALSKA
jgi:8-oxo-dGTP pyrophosphatase MutT (NUDIX family)